MYLSAIKVDPQLTQLVDVVHVHLLLPQQVCHLQCGRHVDKSLTEGGLVVVMTQGRGAVSLPR